MVLFFSAKLPNKVFSTSFQLVSPQLGTVSIQKHPGVGGQDVYHPVVRRSVLVVVDRCQVLPKSKLFELEPTWNV